MSSFFPKLRSSQGILPINWKRNFITRTRCITIGKSTRTIVLIHPYSIPNISSSIRNNQFRTYSTSEPGLFTSSEIDSDNNKKNETGAIEPSLSSSVHTSSIEESQPLISLDNVIDNKRGRKIKPEKQKIVVLDYKQAGLLNDKNDTVHNNRYHNSTRLDETYQNIFLLKDLPDLEPFIQTTSRKHISKQSALTQKNAEDHTKKGSDKKTAKTTTNSKLSTFDLQEIESQTNDLLRFESSVTLSQVMKSIDSQKPLTKVISHYDFSDLYNKLALSYTLPQLRAYTKLNYNYSLTHLTKKKIINRIILKFWDCRIITTNEDSTEQKEDISLINRHKQKKITKTYEVSTIDLKHTELALLIFTERGKLLKNLTKMNDVTIAFPLDENKLIIKAVSRKIINYLEISIRKILSNVTNEFIDCHSLFQKLSIPQINNLINLIEINSGTVFEQIDKNNNNNNNNNSNNSNNSNNNINEMIFKVSAFGQKRIEFAKRLLYWGTYEDNNLIEKTVLCVPHSIRETEPTFKKYSYNDMESFNWIDKNKDWYRLQTPYSLHNNNKPTVLIPSNPIRIDEVNDFKDFYFNFDKKKNELPHTANDHTSISMTLGVILNSKDSTKPCFQPYIPQLKQKLLHLPLFNPTETQDELYSIDKHDYYLQLKFIPISHSITAAYPIELWFELDELENIQTETLQVITPRLTWSFQLQTPTLSHDFAINFEHYETMTKEMENRIHDTDLNLNSRDNKLNVPNVISLNGTQYRFINSQYHRVLRLKYLNKYLVQMSDIDSGTMGGKFTRVDFIYGDNDNNIGNVNGFINDVLNF
ncbi:Sls1p NDAI_0G02480 [Naumovozyma dairenensis CBS 421]|uniref:Uncharacterized protein n=1 Tax=Naumovozyma dairenensis (strain ATCC 10597 / BCRC 20456 / CBS 421 / NBRC 0211 / NRRL Y-12639) TaxID=1071378 RepID=G0WE13_NAUDC|nr:hypothetical protein NDAI_0G02480 [Naumovozyma dairenensis CBS 421]CCD26024.2 hypothetical protein NDAI_0G02480 [Naumovozyma dairenensis CBS 421]